MYNIKICNYFLFKICLVFLFQPSLIQLNFNKVSKAIKKNNKIHLFTPSMLPGLSLDYLSRIHACPALFKIHTDINLLPLKSYLLPTCLNSCHIEIEIVYHIKKGVLNCKSEYARIREFTASKIFIELKNADKNNVKHVELNKKGHKEDVSNCYNDGIITKNNSGDKNLMNFNGDLNINDNKNKRLYNDLIGKERYETMTAVKDELYSDVNIILDNPAKKQRIDIVKNKRNSPINKYSYEETKINKHLKNGDLERIKDSNIDFTLNKEADCIKGKVKNSIVSIQDNETIKYSDKDEMCVNYDGPKNEAVFNNAYLNKNKDFLDTSKSLKGIAGLEKQKKKYKNAYKRNKSMPNTNKTKQECIVKKSTKEEHFSNPGMSIKLHPLHNDPIFSVRCAAIYASPFTFPLSKLLSDSFFEVRLSVLQKVTPDCLNTNIYQTYILLDQLAPLILDINHHVRAQVSYTLRHFPINLLIFKKMLSKNTLSTNSTDESMEGTKQGNCNNVQGNFIHGLEDENEKVRIYTIESMCILLIKNRFNLFMEVFDFLIDLLNDDVESVKECVGKYMLKIVKNFKVNVSLRHVDLVMANFEERNECVKGYLYEVITYLVYTDDKKSISRNDNRPEIYNIVSRNGSLNELELNNKSETDNKSANESNNKFETHSKSDNEGHNKLESSNILSSELLKKSESNNIIRSELLNKANICKSTTNTVISSGKPCYKHLDIIWHVYNKLQSLAKKSVDRNRICFSLIKIVQRNLDLFYELLFLRINFNFTGRKEPALNDNEHYFKIIVVGELENILRCEDKMKLLPEFIEKHLYYYRLRNERIYNKFEISKKAEDIKNKIEEIKEISKTKDKKGEITDKILETKDVSKIMNKIDETIVIRKIIKDKIDDVSNTDEIISKLEVITQSNDFTPSDDNKLSNIPENIKRIKYNEKLTTADTNDRIIDEENLMTNDQVLYKNLVDNNKILPVRSLQSFTNPLYLNPPENNLNVYCEFIIDLLSAFIKGKNPLSKYESIFISTKPNDENDTFYIKLFLAIKNLILANNFFEIMKLQILYEFYEKSIEELLFQYEECNKSQEIISNNKNNNRHDKVIGNNRVISKTNNTNSNEICTMNSFLGIDHENAHKCNKTNTLKLTIINGLKTLLESNIGRNFNAKQFAIYTASTVKRLFLLPVLLELSVYSEITKNIFIRLQGKSFVNYYKYENKIKIYVYDDDSAIYDINIVLKLRDYDIEMIEPVKVIIAS